MQIQVSKQQALQVEADALVLPCFEGQAGDGMFFQVVNDALGGVLGKELIHHQALFQAKLNQTLVLPTYGQLPVRSVILVGAGKAEAFTAEKLRQVAATLAKTAQGLKFQAVALPFEALNAQGLKLEFAAQLITEGAMLATYQFQLRKTKAGTEESVNTDQSLQRLPLLLKDTAQQAAVEQGVKRGHIIASATNAARDWVNDSPNIVTPEFLKWQAEQLEGVSCKVLDFEAIKTMGMGAFALVAQGSTQPAYLIHLTYKPKGEIHKKIALVGKGITFDSGGLSLKPPLSMELMKMDMAGAAAVIATLKAVSALALEGIEVHGFIPTCENMPSGGSSKPGDIIKTLNGKTVEVNNTDAEGRLILCDALTYAQQQVQADALIDIATLTGACITALGKAVAGIMGNDESFISTLRRAGETAGEKLWPLPLFDEYKSYLKSDVADLINAGAKGEAGSSAGGMFLKEFIQPQQVWCHLDIAGPAWLSQDLPEVPKGGTGFGTRTLIYYCCEQAGMTF